MVAETLFDREHEGVLHKLSKDSKGLLLIIGRGRARVGPKRLQYGNTADTVAEKFDRAVEALPPELLALIEHGPNGAPVELDDDRHSGRGCSPCRTTCRSRYRSPVDCLGLEHDLLSECSTFVNELPNDLRYPRRSRSMPQQFSPSKGWSAFELERTGQRHARTRDVSYRESRQNEAELTATLEREQAARDRLEQRQEQLLQCARQLRGIVDQAKGDLNQQAVSTLQHALLELLDDEHEAEAPADDGEGGEGDEQHMPPLFEAAATVNGDVGRVVLGADILLWGKQDAAEPAIQLPLVSISGIGVKRVQLNPFKRADRCTLEGKQQVCFDFAGADGRELSEQFRIAVEERVAAAAAAEAAATATATCPSMP